MPAVHAEAVARRRGELFPSASLVAVALRETPSVIDPRAAIRSTQHEIEMPDSAKTNEHMIAA
jgi:hypothetical protein